MLSKENSKTIALRDDKLSSRSVHAYLQPRSLRSSGGYSMVETLIVVALIAILSAMAVPQLIAERRLSRSIGVTRQILSQMRMARQMAMSQRQAFTFQYDDLTKRILIIDHNVNTGIALLNDPIYPNNPERRVISNVPLATEGLVQSEITYGIPGGIPTIPLRDGTVFTLLNNNQLNITFQPDGSAIDAGGNPIRTALFIYNSRAAAGTASAISVVGASGRIKIWRYDRNANAYSD